MSDGASTQARVIRDFPRNGPALENTSHRPYH